MSAQLPMPAPMCLPPCISPPPPHTHACLSRFIQDTAMDRELPPCVAHAMPQLWFPHTDRPQARQGRQPRLSVFVSLAALLLVVLAVLALAATLAGRRAARRRRQLQWIAADRPARDLYSLLHHNQQQRHSSAPALLHAEAGEAGDAPMLSRRGQARLAALLQAELGGQQLGIELMPLDALPAALAHQLGSLRKAVAAGSSLQGSRRGTRPLLLAAAEEAVAGGAGAADRLPEDADPLLSSGRWAAGLDLRAPGSRLAISASGSGGRSGGGRSSSSSSGPPTSRQWGLPTDSLRLPSSDLTVGNCLCCRLRGTLLLAYVACLPQPASGVVCHGMAKAPHTHPMACCIDWLPSRWLKMSRPGRL